MYSIKEIKKLTKEKYRDTDIVVYKQYLEILSFLLKKDLLFLYKNQDELFNIDIDKYWFYLNELEQGKPLYYITNNIFFYNINLFVDERVLIPRPETEELASIINQIILQNPNIENVFDVGTGSGAIALALAKENQNLNIIASDISKPCLEVSQINKENLNIKNVDFIEGDCLKPFIEKKLKCDLLICNPPYIKNEEKISFKVKDYEPNIALFGGKQGLDIFIKILKDYKNVMKDKIMIFFEIGYDQKNILEPIIKNDFSELKYKFIKDIQNKNRFLLLTKGEWNEYI